MEQNLPFDVDALLVFGKVVECRSLSKAAALLGMPKSTVSRKLTKLESDLGIKLLRKNTHQLTVTDLGEKVYEPRRQHPDRGQRRSRAGRRQQAGTAGRAAGRHTGLRRHRLRVPGRRHVPAALSPLAVGHPAGGQHGRPDQGRVRRGVRNRAAAGFDADRAKGVQPRAVSLRVTGLRAAAGRADHRSGAVGHAAVHRLRLRRARASSRWPRHKRRYELSPQVRARANNFQVCKQYILQGLGIGAMPTQIICTDGTARRQHRARAAGVEASSRWTCT